ncbi:hypothetical protein BC332_33847 [Capsicum chinense]|nr:hypothetical protein BC332_33847 [Capsicum chinense]
MVPCCLGTLVPWCHGTLVPRCHDATMPWSHRAIEPRCLCIMVPRCLGAFVPLCHGATVPSFHGATVPFYPFPWCHGALVPQCLGEWCHGASVPWCLGALLPWFLGAFVPWGDGAGARISNLTKTPPCSDAVVLRKRPLDIMYLTIWNGTHATLENSELAIRRAGKAPEGTIPSISPDRHAATRSRCGSSSSSPPTANEFGTRTPMSSPQCQSFSRSYGSILPTFLTYIIPSTRGPPVVDRTPRNVWCSFNHWTLPPTELIPSRSAQALAQGFTATAVPSYSSGPGTFLDGRVSVQFSIVTRLLVHLASPVLLTKNSPLGALDSMARPDKAVAGPIPKSEERFAYQYRYGYPLEFPLASPHSGIVHHLLGLERVWGSGFGVRGSRFRVWGLGFRVQGLGFRVWGSGFRVRGSRFGVRGLGFGVRGSEFRVWGLGFGDQGSGFRVQGLGFWVQGSRFRVLGSGFRVQGSGFRFHVAMVPRCLGAMLPWCLGTTVPWCHGALVPSCHGALLPWYLGAMVPRYLSATVP